MAVGDALDVGRHRRVCVLSVQPPVQGVTVAARFSSFRDATTAVRMPGVDISESQVRRLAHEVGAELIGELDRRAAEHRRPRSKEDNIACLAALSGPAFTADPCPEPPDAFRCPFRERPAGHKRADPHPVQTAA